MYFVEQNIEIFYLAEKNTTSLSELFNISNPLDKRPLIEWLKISTYFTLYI